MNNAGNKFCKYCDREISKYNINKHEKHCMYNPDNYTECLECHNQIHHTKKFCNSSCAAKYNNQLSVAPKRKRTGENRECLNCTVIFYTTISEDKKYCSNNCQQEKRWQNRKKIIETHGVKLLGIKSASEDTILKKYLIEKYGEKCMECGWNEVNKYTGLIPIQIDHIDGNPKNQSLKNIRLVCPNCHSLTPFFGSRGNGGREK